MKPLAPGDKVLLVDSKGRQYLVELVEDGEFHTHTGIVPHAELIGKSEGTTVRSTAGARYTAMRPTLTDFVLRMPRGAQVIYPKDLGPILLLADIQPGLRVFESGVGSGALSMTLLRAGASVVGYELRDDFAERARGNVTSFLGDDAASRYHVEVRDSYEGIDERDLDRVVLDLPEPWQVVKHAAVAMRPGGILVSYSPSIAQVMQLHEAFEDSGFHLAQTVEILQR
ncbi:MAG: tRNA (adenine57-N1/adenine58-N1)-methyltransferase catalytic subunit, partial [Actinomycetota bacterium]|nr:tRNA (adenine57-N1/adenine58-N1)-methyltransferase catalytic subunit [Actinomycetota bacterium]